MTPWRDKALLTVAELAEVASVAPATVRRAIRCGRLRVVRLGRAVRVPQQEARQFLGEPPPEASSAELDGAAREARSDSSWLLGLALELVLSRWLHQPTVLPRFERLPAAARIVGVREAPIRKGVVRYLEALEARKRSRGRKKADPKEGSKATARRKKGASRKRSARARGRRS